MTEARAKRRRRALAASGILRCQWPLEAQGQDDVDETAAGLWRAREDASWEALLLRLDTSFAVIETEHSRQWRRVLVLLLALSTGCCRSASRSLQPVFVRVDEIGRAEALDYEALTWQNDPLHPSTKYSLRQFVTDHYWTISGGRC